ncbi:unnamed protein product, partial [Urochloa humidicola]
MEASGTNESTNTSSSQTPNKRAPVWEYYEPELVHIDGVLKAVCKYCGTKLNAARKSGTNSLRTHIAEHCPKIPNDDRDRAFVMICVLCLRKSWVLQSLCYDFSFDTQGLEQVLLAIMCYELAI